MGNPPYIRAAGVPALLRAEYVQHTPDYARGDLLHSFLDRCGRALQDGGQLAMVVSDRVLFNEGCARLRAALGQRLSLSHLERIDAATAFIRPKMRRAGAPARVHPVILILGDAGRAITADPIYPGVEAGAYDGFPQLGEIAQVRSAPWLGKGNAFVVTAEQARASGLPDEVLIPAVDTDDCAGGTLREPTRFAIRTYPGVEPCAAVLSHLAREQGRLAPRTRRGSASWLPAEPFHAFDTSRPSLLIPRILLATRAIRLPENILLLNHNISVVSASLAVLDRVERALASPLAASWFHALAPRLENGYKSLTTRLLRRMPIDVPES